ncbi:MAG: SpoVR family protein, partial [Gammaproteobacteria bacterium]
MGNSRLFEVVFPGNPNRAYLADRNTLDENTLVSAHVLGHADFARNNLLFRKSREQVGGRIVEQAAAHARRIEEAIERHGLARVEAVLDAALALEQHIDVTRDVARPRYATERPPTRAADTDPFLARYRALAGERTEAVATTTRLPLPPAPERDLLWLIAHYAPDLEGWERDIFLAVREESFYFHPVFACQIMNEGWACYWHARLLREAGFLPQHVYLDAIKAHSDVVRPYAGSQEVTLAINPYHVGFHMWERLVDRHGLAAARRVMAQDDDFAFVRNHLDEQLAEELALFDFSARASGEVRVGTCDIDTIREQILAPKFNFGAPTVHATHIATDGTLELVHDHARDGRGLALDRACRVLEYIARVWRRPVQIETVDASGRHRVPGTRVQTAHCAPRLTAAGRYRRVQPGGGGRWRRRFRSAPGAATPAR